MSELLTHFHFLRPEWFALAPVLLVIERWLARSAASEDPFTGIIEASLLQHLRLARPRSAWFNPSTALSLLLGLAIIILSGPSWRQQPSPLARDAAPLIVVLDVSASMNTTDIAPSRLERSRQKISDLLTLIPDKQIGLMVFAGSAHTVLPLTSDHDILRSYLSALGSNLAPRAGKFPEYALAGVDRLLRQTRYQASVLLVTDGLGEASPQLMRAWCATTQYELHVYGIGHADPSQSDVPLERDRLQTLADSCGGQYIDITIDTRDVEAIANGLSDRYLILDDAALPWLDGGYGLVFPAMALALLWFRKGWTRVWIWPLLPLIMLLGAPEPAQAQVSREGEAIKAAETRVETASVYVPGMAEQVLDHFVGLWLTPDQYGRVLLALGHYQKAAQTFSSPVWAGTARYYAQEFRQAGILFNRKDSHAALFNEANAHAHRRDYIRAVRRYDELLARAPNFPGAQQNRDLIQTIIDEINRLSESQAGESGVSGDDIDPDNDPQIGDGAEEITFEQQERTQYSAEEILASPETAELWLKNVQQDPTHFLRTKFSVQLQERGVSEP